MAGLAGPGTPSPGSVSEGGSGHHGGSPVEAVSGPPGWACGLGPGGKSLGGGGGAASGSPPSLPFTVSFLGGELSNTASTPCTRTHTCRALSPSERVCPRRTLISLVGVTPLETCAHLLILGVDWAQGGPSGWAAVPCEPDLARAPRTPRSQNRHSMRAPGWPHVSQAGLLEAWGLASASVPGDVISRRRK